MSSSITPDTEVVKGKALIFVAKYPANSLFLKASPAIYLDSPYFDDNQIKGEPDRPGIYLADVEYHFLQGYFEGWKADGESEWWYELSNCQAIEDYTDLIFPWERAEQ